MLLGIFSGSNALEVDLPKFVDLARGKGFLTSKGSYVGRIGNGLGADYGIPIKVTGQHIATDEQFVLPVEDFDDDEYYLLGTTVASWDAFPLPMSRAPTREETERSMDYREHLCHCLDIGPIVVCFETQHHYSHPRPEGVPYRRLRDDNLSRTESIMHRFLDDNPKEDVPLSHCVSAYGYVCGGDVRDLRLMYQENAKGAPGDELQRGLFIDPDAIRDYHFPNLTNMKLSKSPKEGYQTVHLSPSPESPPPPPPRTVWDSIRRTLFR